MKALRLFITQGTTNYMSKMKIRWNNFHWL